MSVERALFFIPGNGPMCRQHTSWRGHQVIDAVLRKHGVGCMLDWVESDLVLKEKTANIQARARYRMQ